MSMSGKPNRGKYWTSTDETVDMSREEREFLTAQIREQLTQYRLTQVWLIRQLSVIGLLTDKSEMSSVLSGTRLGSKADEILRKSAKYRSHSPLPERAVGAHRRHDCGAYHGGLICRIAVWVTWSNAGTLSPIGSNPSSRERI